MRHTTPLPATNQIGDTLHVDNVIHDEIVETARSRHDDFHTLGDNVDLLAAIPASIHTATTAQKGTSQ